MNWKSINNVQKGTYQLFLYQSLNSNLRIESLQWYLILNPKYCTLHYGFEPLIASQELAIGLRDTQGGFFQYFLGKFLKQFILA